MVYTNGQEEVIEEILTLRRKMNAADEDRDLETYLRNCTDNVVAIPPGRPPVQGIGHLREFLTGVHTVTKVRSVRSNTGLPLWSSVEIKRSITGWS